MGANITIDGDVAGCAAIVQRGDPDRFLAIMSAPVAQRGALFIIFAFNLEVARAPWVTKEAMIAEMRLQWWADAIEEIYAGKTVRRHEVVTPLAALINQMMLPRELFDELISARRWDIYNEPHAHAFAFEDYIMHSSGNLMALASLSVGMPMADLSASKDYGYGDGIARLFLAIPALENAQRKPLVDGRNDAVGKLAADALNRMQSASFSDRSGNCALRTGWLAKTLLKTAKRNPALVGQGALEPTEFRKKLTLLVRSFTNTY
jgi:hypothetical protein